MMRIYHQLSFTLWLISTQQQITAWHSVPSHDYNQKFSRRCQIQQTSTHHPSLVRNMNSNPSNLFAVSKDYQGDPVLRLPLMEAELATLMEGQQTNSIDDETQESIERLQTDISNAKTSAEFGIRKSQSEFYEAFATGDIDAMSAVWSDTSPIRCVHPGMTSIDGRSDVLESWKQIFAPMQQQQSNNDSDSEAKFEIEPSRTQIDICGLTAICSCVEKTQGGGELEVINIYKRENGSWKMTLHHAGPVVMRSSSSGAIF